MTTDYMTYSESGAVAHSLDIKWNDYPSDVLYLWNGETLYRIAEGTGDNLSEEDIANGYVDYWNTEYYSLDTCDGGMWLETQMISDIDYTLKGVMDRLMGCDLWEDNWKVIDEKTGDMLCEEFEKYYIAKRRIKWVIDDIVSKTKGDKE